MTDFNWGWYKTGVLKPLVLIEGLQYRVFLNGGTLSYNGTTQANNTTFKAIEGKLTRTDVTITGGATYEVDATQTVFVNNLYDRGSIDGDGTMGNPYRTIAQARTAGKINNVFGGTAYAELLELAANAGVFAANTGIVWDGLNNTAFSLPSGKQQYYYNLIIKNTFFYPGSPSFGGSYLFNKCILDNVRALSNQLTVTTATIGLRNSLVMNVPSGTAFGFNINSFIAGDIHNNTFHNCANLYIGTTYTGSTNLDIFKYNIFNECPSITFASKTQLKYSLFKGNCGVKFGSRSLISYTNVNPSDAVAGFGFARLQNEHYLAFTDETVHLEGCKIDDTTDNLFVDKARGNYAIQPTHAAGYMQAGKAIGAYKVGLALRPVAVNTASTKEFTPAGVITNMTIADNSITLASTASNGSTNGEIDDFGTVREGVIVRPLGTEMTVNGEQFTARGTDLGSQLNDSTILSVGSMYQVDDVNLPVFAEKGIDIPSGSIVTGTKYVVRASAGEFITYNANNYGNGIVFQGLAGLTTYTETGNCLVYEIVQYDAHQMFRAVYTRFYNFPGNTVNVREWLRIINPRTFKMLTSVTDATLASATLQEFLYNEPMMIDGAGKGNGDSAFDTSTAILHRFRYYKPLHQQSVDCRKP